MPADTLDFEEPVAVLLKEIEALGMLPQTPERVASIAQLESRVAGSPRRHLQRLEPWQVVQVARHASRPCTLDYVGHLIEGFTELHGDRRFADDKAIVAGFGFYHGEPVMVVGHQKGSDTKQKIYRNFGYAKPEGYRKALRVMKMAEKFQRPVSSFIDTPAAYPGIESEERGVAEAIALNLREMSQLDVPIVVIVCGEGGQRRRARHCGGRSRADAGIRDLQRHSAGGLRGHPLARRRAQGGGGGGVEDHRAGPAARSASSTKSSASPWAARTRITRAAAALLDEAIFAASRGTQGARLGGTSRSALREIPGDGGERHRGGGAPAPEPAAKAEAPERAG